MALPDEKMPLPLDLLLASLLFQLSSLYHFSPTLLGFGNDVLFLQQQKRNENCMMTRTGEMQQEDALRNAAPRMFPAEALKIFLDILLRVTDDERWQELLEHPYMYHEEIVSVRLIMEMRRIHNRSGLSPADRMRTNPRLQSLHRRSNP